MLLEEREREYMRALLDGQTRFKLDHPESRATPSSPAGNLPPLVVRTGQPDVSSSESSERVSLVERTHSTGCKSGEVCRRRRDGPSSLSKRSCCLTSHITTKD